MGQVAANAVIAAATYALVAVGFSLVYRTQRFFYVAHGGVLAVSAFAFWAVSTRLQSLFLGALASLVVGGACAAANERLVHRPLRARARSGLSLFLASTGAYYMIENGLLLGFGPDVRTIAIHHQPVYTLGDAHLTLANITGICISILSCGGLYCLLKWTRFGQEIRAVADNERLAAVYGINVAGTHTRALMISGVLASLAAVVLALNTNLRFNMGMPPLLKGIAASMLGGVGNIPAAVGGAVVIGAVEHIAAWTLPTGYKDVVCFGILVLVICLRPRGIAGMVIRRA